MIWEGQDSHLSPLTLIVTCRYPIPQMTQATMETTIFETHSVSAALGLPVQVSDLTLL